MAEVDEGRVIDGALRRLSGISGHTGKLIEENGGLGQLVGLGLAAEGQAVGQDDPVVLVDRAGA